MLNIFNKSDKKYSFKSGAILSYITLGANCAVGIFFTPYIIRMLGEGEYGLYQMIGAFVGYLSILDMGMSSAVTKYVAKYYRLGEKNKEENFLAFMLIYYTFISFIILLLGRLLYGQIGNIFSDSLTDIELIKAEKMFIILIFNLIVTLYGGIFRGVMNAYEYFLQAKSIELLKVILRIAMIYGILTLGGDSIGLVLVDTLLNVFFIGYPLFFCINHIHCSFRLHGINIMEMKEVAFYSFFVFLNLVFDQLNWKIDHMIVGIKVSTVAVTVYSIGMNFSNYFMNFSIAVKSLFLPKVMHMEVLGADGQQYTQFLIKTGRLQGYLLFYLYFAFVFMGRQFIHIIMGKDYYDAWLSAVLVMSGLLIPLLQNAGHPILQVKNKHYIYVTVCLLVSIVNAVATWFIVDKRGIVGAAFMTMLSFFAGQAVFLSWYYHNKLNINMKLFFKEIGKANLIPVLIVVTLECTVGGIVEITSWFTFILHGAIYSLVYFLCIIKWGMNNWEKNYLFSYFHKHK